jgi:hypothetical protein
MEENKIINFEEFKNKILHANHKYAKNDVQAYSKFMEYISIGHANLHKEIFKLLTIHIDEFEHQYSNENIKFLKTIYGKEHIEEIIDKKLSILDQLTSEYIDLMDNHLMSLLDLAKKIDEEFRKLETK